MLSYKDFTDHFGLYLTDATFQAFLNATFKGLGSYNILESDYMSYEDAGIELGFTNNNGVYDDDEGIILDEGNPVFSHINFYLKSDILINTFPFGTSFKDTRISVTAKAGHPTKTNKEYADFLNRDVLVDSYKFGNVVISFDYEANYGTINFIQIRDNNLVSHLK